MGSGGGGTSTQYVKSETSNLPAYAQPYVTNLMEKAQAITGRPYIPYGYTQDASGRVVKATDASGNPINPQRIADFTPEQRQVQQNILGQQTPEQFGMGSQLAGAAGLGSLMAGQYDPSQFRAQRVRGPNLNYFQMQGPDSFTQQGTAEQYMSPYMQQAVDVQKQQAIRDAQQGQLAQNLGAARQGTYGGSRQLLASIERERNLGQQLGNIQATGQQAAYQQAQQQFNTEQAARQQAAQQNLQAALGVQGIGAQYGMQAALANQQAALDAQKAAEQSRQFGANLGLQGLAQAGQMGQTLGNLGQMQGQMDLARLNQQQQTAAQQQALNQQYLDLPYQDYLRQQNYAMEQLSQLAGIIHGVPMGQNVTQTTSAPAPSIASQILGTGLGALSMYKTLGG